MVETQRKIYRQRRWKQSTRRISVYTLIVSILWHAAVLFTFRFPKAHIGNWQRRASLFWLTTSREQRSAEIPAVQRLYVGMTRLLDEPDRPGLSAYPVETLLSSGRDTAGSFYVTYNRKVKESIGQLRERRYEWDIYSDSDIFREYSITNAPPRHIPERAAEFHVTVVYPSRHILVNCVDTSGEAEFDAIAADAIKRFPLKQPHIIHGPDDTPFYAVETAIVYVTLACEGEK